MRNIGMKAKNKKPFLIFQKNHPLVSLTDYTIVNHIGNVYYCGYNPNNSQTTKLFQYSIMDKHKAKSIQWKTFTDAAKKKLLKKELAILRANARMNLDWLGKELVTLREFKSLPAAVLDFINYNTSLDNDSALLEIRLKL
jgi:hypothetical protein